jgi:hypothetical protein
MFVDQLVLTPPPAASTWCGDAYPDVITTVFEEVADDEPTVECEGAAGERPPGRVRMPSPV